MIDIHNHLQDARLSPFREQIIEDMRAVGITACVVNGTCEADWPEVARLARDYPDFVIPAFGLHPWKTKEKSPNWLSTLRQFLLDHPHAHLGECGLDRWISNPDLPDQIEVFRQQLSLAHELQRPTTIHCLKAWALLLETLASSPIPPRILLHSYSGSIETAHQLAPYDPWFSFSGYFLQEKKSAIREVFRQLPPDRLLIETDAPDMPLPDELRSHPLPAQLNHPAHLPEIAKGLIQLMPQPFDLKLVRQNTGCFLKYD